MGTILGEYDVLLSRSTSCVCVCVYIYAENLLRSCAIVFVHRTPLLVGFFFFFVAIVSDVLVFCMPYVVV
jgi:hypothetical protein